MARAYMLFGFTVFLVQLHVSGNITKYINMKYSYLSLTAAILFGLLTVSQVIHVFKTEGNHDHEHDHDCDHTCHHGHVHKKEKGIKRFLSAIVFIFPVFTGLFLPISTLDSTIVDAKGFHFPVSEPGNNDPFMQRQYLKPDLSVYYGEEGYKQLIKQETKEFVNKNHIELNDENFLKGMEVLYDNPGIFLDKKVTYKGFVYREKTLNNNQAFIFRFGIIHCVADSGVYGMLIDFPKKTDLKNDQWVEVTGSLKQMYYQPFKTTIPYLKVDNIKEVKPPSEPYVYRNK
jgi:putative membrane protein